MDSNNGSEGDRVGDRDGCSVVGDDDELGVGDLDGNGVGDLGCMNDGAFKLVVT